MLRLFADALGVTFRIPHFTTIIRWTMRIGHSLLAASLEITQGWTCILDHTIQVGTKKALVVLMAPLNVMNRKVALGYTDVKVVGIEVRDKWNGEIVEAYLRKLFFKIGFPDQIIRDGGSDLKRGIENMREKIPSSIKVTYDITHFIGNLLKRKYSKDLVFQEIRSAASLVRKQILQTSLCYLLPPKERSKGKFLNLPAFSKWLTFIKQYLQDHPENNKAHDIFEWIIHMDSWINSFCKEIDTFSKIEEILKNRGCTSEDFEILEPLLYDIEDMGLRGDLATFLEEELEFSHDKRISSLITSDIIESLFGKYKELAKNHSMSEINRSILSIPCICSELSIEEIEVALQNTSQKDLDAWSEKKIGETQLARRLGLKRDAKTNDAPGHKSADIATDNRLDNSLLQELVINAPPTY